MLELIDLLKLSGKIKFTQEFCDSVGLKKQNLRPIKNGKQHFTPEQIRLACLEYNANANWINDLEENPFRSRPKMPLTKKLTTGRQNGNNLKSKKKEINAG